jgi:class 3 adenylate cyclase/tetratricopeptide (TPR) repeat protein
MRVFAFLIALFFVAKNLTAQQHSAHTPISSEKYFQLDSNFSYSRLPIELLEDTIKNLSVIATKADDEEFTLSLRLFLFKKMHEAGRLSKDTTEYLLLSMVADAHDKGLIRTEADIHQTLGDFYSLHAQQSAVLEQQLAAYNIYKNFSNAEYPGKQDHVYKLGLSYYRYEDFTSSIKYLREALGMGSRAKRNLFSPIANTIGLSYRSMKMYDSAIAYFQTIVDSSLIWKEPVWVGIARGNIGITYYLQNDYTKAEPLLKEDIESSLVNSSVRNAVNTMTILASVYYTQHKYDECEKLLLKAASYGHQKSFWADFGTSEKIYEQLYKVYLKKENYRLACLYADSAIMAKDSAEKYYNTLSLSKAYERQNFIRKKLETEKKENEGKLNQLKKLDQQQQLYKFIIGFLVVVIIVAVLVNRFRSNLKVISTSIQDTPEIVVQKMSIVIISIATCAAALVWAALYYYYYGVVVATMGPLIYFLIVGPSLIYYFLSKRQQFLVNVQLICIFCMPLLMQFSAGGFQSGVVINWAILAPVGALMYKGIKEAAFWMVLLVIGVMCTIVFNDFFSTFYHPISRTAQVMFYGMDIIGPAIVIFFCTQFFVKSTIRDGILLQKSNLTLSETLVELKLEKQKSDDLLLNILPEEVAEELKEKGTTTAKHFDNVTVLFTDFVNFTNAGEHMNPQQLIDELHSCFKTFDEITGKYDIEKIKTIGDAYLAVAGLPTPDPHHAENIVRAAMEISAYMQNRLATNGKNTFEVRIGIHSGSAVAGIVGVKKFAYDIWGDTVNTAARMEQNSEAGKINISETTYNLVKDKIKCTYRGEIEAKGKGMLKMYFVGEAG